MAVDAAKENKLRAEKEAVIEKRKKAGAELRYDWLRRISISSKTSQIRQEGSNE